MAVLITRLSCVLVACLSLAGGAAEAEQSSSSACRAAADDDGPGCPYRGAAMIQTNANGVMQPATMLQKSGSQIQQKVQVLTALQRTSLTSRMQLLGKQASTAGIMVQRAMSKVSAEPANELDQLIFNFMASNSDSQDACPAKLLQAKHQLNQLHKHMYSVAYEINSTSSEIKHVSKEVETLTLEWKTEQGQCEEEKEKCEKERAFYKKQWEILRWELIEMQQIANPSVQITASDMSYAAWKSKTESMEESSSNTTRNSSGSTSESSEDSGAGPVPEFDGLPGDKPIWWPTLLQVHADPKPVTPIAGGAKAVSALVLSTKSYAQELQHCMWAFSQQKSKRADPLESSYDTSGGDANHGWTKNGNRSSWSDGESSGTSNDDGGNGSRWSASNVSNYTNTTTWYKSFSNTSSNSNISEACKRQLVAFETVYYKAYRQVVRLISEYEVLVNSTECEDAVDESCKEQDSEYSTKTTKETEHLSEMTEKMSKVKGHITVMSNQEMHLTQHIAQLTVNCHTLDETVSDLDKVRDAIHIFDVCAGLGRPNFHIPIYTGQTITFEYDTTHKTDAEIDADLNSVCNNVSFNGLIARSAETSEIMQQAVEGMPTHNNAFSMLASAPLFGTCPHCQGDKDTPGNDSPTHATGYYRTCWDAEAMLDGSSMRSNCGGGVSYKSVMCVVDRFDVVNGGDGYQPTSPASTSSSTSTSSSSSSSSSTSSATGPGSSSTSTSESTEGN